MLLVEHMDQNHVTAQTFVTIISTDTTINTDTSDSTSVLTILSTTAT